MEDINRPSSSQSQNADLHERITHAISARTPNPRLRVLYINSFNTEFDVVKLLNILRKTEKETPEILSALEGLTKFTIKVQGASWAGLRPSILLDDNLIERVFQVLLKMCHLDSTRIMAEASQLISVNYHLLHQRLKLSLQKEIVLFFVEKCREPYLWDMDHDLKCVAQATYYVIDSSAKSLFQTLFTQVESNSVLKSIYFILENRSFEWPGYFMMAEMLNIVTGIVRLFTNKVKPLCVLEQPSLWLKIIFPLMFLEEARVRRAALTALESLHNYRPSKAFCSPAEWRKIKLLFEKRFCKQLVNYAHENQSGWTRMWRFILNLIMEDSVSPRNNTLFNQILVVEEKAFKAHCCDTRLLAFSCWKILISKFLNPNSSDAARWLKLFLQPLTATNCKTDILSHSKLDMYWEIICKLSPKFEKFADQVLPHFLRFCFGPLGELGIERNTTDILLSPGRRFHSLHIPCASALAQMLLVKCDSVSTNVTFALPHLKESLLSNPKLFVHLSKLIFLSVCECTLILSSLEDLEKYSEDDLKQRSIYCELIWNNLLHHVKSALALPRVKDSNNDQISVLMKNFFNALNLMFEHAKDDSQVAGTCLSTILKSILMGSNSLPLEDLLIPSFVDTKVEVIYGTPLRFLVSLVMSTMLLSTRKYKKMFMTDLDHFLTISVAANGPTYLYVSLTVCEMLDELMNKKIVSSVLLTMISTTWCTMMKRFDFLLRTSANMPNLESDGVWIHNVLEFPARHLHRWNEDCLAYICASWKSVLKALADTRAADNIGFFGVYSRTFYQLVPYMFKIRCVKDGPIQQASMLYMIATLLEFTNKQYLLDQMSVQSTVPGHGVEGFVRLIVELSKYAGKEPVKANAFYVISLLDCLYVFFRCALREIIDEHATCVVMREFLVPIKNATKYVQTETDTAKNEYVDKVVRMWKAYVTPLKFLERSTCMQILIEISTAWKDAIWNSIGDLSKYMFNMSMRRAQKSICHSEIIAALRDNFVVCREQTRPQTDNDAASAQNQSSVPQQPGVSHSAMDNNRTPTLTHYQRLKIKNRDDTIPALYSDLTQESQNIIRLSDVPVLLERNTEVEYIQGPVLQLPIILDSRHHMKANICTFIHKGGIRQSIRRPVLMKTKENISPASASSAPGRSLNIEHTKTLKYENKSKVLRTFQASGTEKNNLVSVVDRNPGKVHDCEKLIDTNMSKANVTTPFDVINENLDKNVQIELALRNVENECSSSGREGKDNQVGESVIQTGYSQAVSRRMQSELKKENRKNVHSEGKEENIPIKLQDSKFIVHNNSSVIDETQISSISLSNLKRCQVQLKKLPLDISALDTVYVQEIEGVITLRKKSSCEELILSECDYEQNYNKPTGPCSAALDIEGDGCPDNNTNEYPSPSSAKILLHTIGDNSTVNDVLHTYNGCNIKAKLWVRHVYDPCSPPVWKSSLKRKCDMTPPSGSKCKKRRVNFLEPEVTKCLIFNKHPDEPQGKISVLPRRSCRRKDNGERNKSVPLPPYIRSHTPNMTAGASKKCRAQIGSTYNASNICDPTEVNSITTSLPGPSSMKMKCFEHLEGNWKTPVASPPVSQESQGSVYETIPEMPVCKKPIYAPLAYCKDTVDIIIKEIFGSITPWARVVIKNLQSHGIFTIGDFCRLPEIAIDILPLVEPKLKTFVGVAQNYEKFKEMEKKEKSYSG